MRTLKIILILLIIPRFILAQMEENTVEKGMYKVISTTGLNFRAEPNLNSKVLFSLPFGAAVEVVEDWNYGIDTIGHADLEGRWVRVREGNTYAYAFDAFLLNGEASAYEDARTEGLHEEYVFLFPSHNCFNNFNYPEGMYWYGMYKDEQSFIMKEVQVSFTQNSMYEIPYTHIGTNKDEGLLFIIGSMKPITNKRKHGLYQPDFWSHNYKDLPEFNLEGSEFINSFNISDGQVKQALNTENTNIPSSVLWKGDIDEDGKPDYIIHYGEDGGETYLYMSSKAEKDEVVKPVAVYFSGYCC